jgi:pyrimidine-nucleoside phosphorylase
MRAVDIINKKREGQELSAEEIQFFIDGFANDEIPDYQVSAWAMAVLFQGMSSRETTDLTHAMVETGDRIDLSGVVPLAVDKHSTGGVGDKTTLAVEPAVAACGVPVGKMSGRGLGFSGGTLDKLESIPGFRVELTTDEFKAQLAGVGLVLAGQTADLAPADGKLYALRDVTGTVASVPLIASSIMSKKIAAGADAVVLDVKVGVGAFMRTVEGARELAQLMVEIGKRAGRQVVALLSDMNQPLGAAVGNALEVREAIQTLHGSGPPDFVNHCLEVAGHMLMLAKRVDDIEAGRERVQQALQDGSAYAKFIDLIRAQGGDTQFVEEPDLLPTASLKQTVTAERAGFVEMIAADQVGIASVELGAGRKQKGDQIDHAVGIVVHKKVGERLGQDETIFTVHANDQPRLDLAIERLLQAISITDSETSPLPHLYDTIYSH